MSKYAVFFTLMAEAIARAMERPSDRVTVVSKAVESAGGRLEAYYLMFGQYDGFVIVDLPDSRAAAATSLAVSSTGAFEHLETHELIEAEDLNPILEQAKGITSQLPDASSQAGSAPSSRPPGGPEFRSLFARTWRQRALIGSGRSCPIQQQTARPAGWPGRQLRWLLLALQRPHVGGLRNPSAPASRRTRRLGPHQVSGSQPTGSR
jgi:uncharacterized protein with GYD domain